MSISTSETGTGLSPHFDVRREQAFSVIELLLGLFLALGLALGVAPLWVSLQSVSAQEADGTIWALQGRVAGARFERDLRLAGAQCCPFATAATVLEATSSQVVLLVPASRSVPPLLVEWELVGGSLMRRWGECPATRPLTFSHSLYTDNKTMLENVDTVRSMFSYEVAGRSASAPIPADDLPLVSLITMEVASRTEGTGAAARVTVSGPVAR